MKIIFVNWDYKMNKQAILALGQERRRKEDEEEKKRKVCYYEQKKGGKGKLHDKILHIYDEELSLCGLACVSYK